MWFDYPFSMAYHPSVFVAILLWCLRRPLTTWYHWCRKVIVELFLSLVPPRCLWASFYLSRRLTSPQKLQSCPNSKALQENRYSYFLTILIIQIVHRHSLVDYHLGVFCSVLRRIWIDYVQKDRPKYRFSLAKNLLCDFSMNDDQQNLWSKKGKILNCI